MELPAFAWLKVSMASVYELQNISDLSSGERQEGKDWWASCVEQRIGFKCAPSFCILEAEEGADLQKTHATLKPRIFRN